MNALKKMLETNVRLMLPLSLAAAEKYLHYASLYDITFYFQHINASRIKCVLNNK